MIACAQTNRPRPGGYGPGSSRGPAGLCVAGRDAEALAREHGTPLFAFDLTDVADRVRRVQAALAATGLRSRVRFALKAQREPEVLALLRGLGAPGTPQSVGVDVCSPGEVAWALDHGWQAQELSFTGTNLVDRDLRDILAHPLKLNVDLLSQLRRVGRLAPGRRVGLRLNPRAGAARRFVPAGRSPDDELQFGIYASEKPTKFGIYAEQLDEAVAIAREHDLVIDTVCVHICHQMHTAELPQLDHALAVVAAMVERLREAGCPIEEVNTGGGLGEPMMAGETDLDLDAWADVVARRLGAARGDDRRRARGVLLCGERRAARRGGDGRGSSGHDLRGPERRLEHGAVTLCVGRMARHRARRRAARAPASAGDDRRQHQRGARPVRRRLRVSGGRRGRHRGSPERRAATARPPAAGTACGRWRRPCTSATAAQSSSASARGGPAGWGRPATTATAPVRETSVAAGGRRTGRTPVRRRRL